ncbi:hypothetical protein GIB67_011565 [Kingdonia uniflora]|uniref:Uncharacterized protein n=1 Tax=Kingdonia uniflora TaxID=39325 RepID=A0A7J7NMD0_9MAGN|nr:hypothetical protein GIB67_011565 [Kingdonia uniflora]
MLRPIPFSLASCTRYFKAMAAMRETFATLLNLRVVGSSYALPSTPAKNNFPRLATVASGAALVKLLEYEVCGARISLQIAYGVEVEVENNPYDPSLMVFMYYRD